MKRNSLPRRPGWLGLAASLLVLMVGPCHVAMADVKVPAIFGSHMVLQRDQKDRVWGWADPGEGVTVKLAGQEKSAKAGPDGSWQVVLDPIAAGGPHTLTIQGKNTIKLDDVLVGEVWICSGQSNMQMEIASSKDADLEIRTAKYPRIRLISVPQVGTQEPQKDFKGQWQPCGPDTAARFSAVGYFFGRRLQQALDLPIGLIDDSWGGSACEAWIRRDVLAADAKYAPLLKHWEQIEKNFPQAKSEYEAKRTEWKKNVDKAKAQGKQPPRPPSDPRI